MTAVSLKRILKDANKNKYAVAGLVVLGWDDALAFTQAADETGIPIILQAGPSCRAHTPVPILGKMFRYLADQTKTHICCHIDHGYTIRECIEGIDSGFTSVMFDGSKLSLKENIKITSSIVKKAHNFKVSSLRETTVFPCLSSTTTAIGFASIDLAMDIQSLAIDNAFSKLIILIIPILLMF